MTRAAIAAIRLPCTMNPSRRSAKKKAEPIVMKAPKPRKNQTGVGIERIRRAEPLPPAVGPAVRLREELQDDAAFCTLVRAFSCSRSPWKLSTDALTSGLLVPALQSRPLLVYPWPACNRSAMPSIGSFSGGGKNSAVRESSTTDVASFFCTGLGVVEAFWKAARTTKARMTRKGGAEGTRRSRRRRSISMKKWSAFDRRWTRYMRLTRCCGANGDDQGHQPEVHAGRHAAVG